MKKYAILLILFVVLSDAANAKVTTDTLTLKWESSVKYGSHGQRTVVVNNVLWHLGGSFEYGKPYGYDTPDCSPVEWLDQSAGLWTITSYKILYRTWINAESYGNKIYIFGGFQLPYPYTYRDELEIFDPATGTVTFGAPMPFARISPGSVQVDGKIYVIGGSDQNGYIDRLDIYDIASDTWKQGAMLPLAMQTEAVYSNGKIIVMGGYNGNEQDGIYEYEIATNTWQEIGKMPRAVSAHKLAIFNNYIYCIGDYTDLDVLMRYDMTTGDWTVYTSNYIPRRHTSLAILDNKLYIVAGNSSMDGTYQSYKIVQGIDLSKITHVNSMDSVTPKSISLAQNYPNPFNAATSIYYEIAQQGNVSLVVFDIRGRKVRDFVNSYQEAGRYHVSWDGKNETGQNVASGQYFYIVHLNDEVLEKRMLLIK